LAFRHHDPSAPSEQDPGHGLSPVELGHGAGTLVCPQRCERLFLAEGLKQKDNTVRQRLREWCYEAAAKRGKQRQAVHVESCFAPLLAWVLSWWMGTQLALALDATTLGSRFVVLAISVLYCGCAIPGYTQHSYRIWC
jgi:hypothetical protein